MDKRSFLRSALPLVIVMGASKTLESLPAFQQLMERRTGYAVGCGACHQPGSGSMNPYGKEFLRLGYDDGALDALDLMDPDHDGLSSKAELKERSNPGEDRSVPEHVGTWLARRDKLDPSPEIGREVFGRPVAWDVVQRRLRSSQIREAETFLKEKLKDADHYPTVFIVRERLSGKPSPPAPRRRSQRDPWADLNGEKLDVPAAPPAEKGRKGKVLGRAGYAYFGDRRMTVFLVFLKDDASLLGVRPVSVGADRRLGKEEYYSQFAGKTYSTIQAVEPPHGAESENSALIAAVRRGMKLIELAAPLKE